MMLRFKVLMLGLLIISCKSYIVPEKIESNSSQLTIAFGSCNKQFKENKLWDDVLKNNPKIWIWGGDVIYSDTDDMNKMKQDYDEQLLQNGYSELQQQTKILGTWDDHDYGLNDGGEEFKVKRESQQLFLDFMGVDKDDNRRNREGVYHAEIIESDKGSVKIIVLDTRYFRTALTTSKNRNKRYDPNVYGEGTVLGEQQWEWLVDELNSSKADFNLIVSSIQILSSEHGFETWGNFPHEVDKLKTLIKSSKANGVLLLSGDRHISEFSKTEMDDLNYPLIDFTSSGLTHSYSGFSGESNQFRVGKVIPTNSFGLLKINFDSKTIIMQMRGDANILQQEIMQKY